MAGSGIILLCASVAVSNRIYFSFETLSDQNHVKRINYNRIIVALDLIRFHVNVALNSDKIAWRNSTCHTTFHFSNYVLCNARYKTGFFEKNLQIIIIMKAVHQFSFWRIVFMGAQNRIPNQDSNPENIFQLFSHDTVASTVVYMYFFKSFFKLFLTGQFHWLNPLILASIGNLVRKFLSTFEQIFTIYFFQTFFDLCLHFFLHSVKISSDFVHSKSWLRNMNANFSCACG